MADAPPLQYVFTCTAAPVQAEGTVAGRAFYFRARGEAWTFTVAERPGIDPVGLGAEDAERGDVWYRAGDVSGGRFAASYLPLDEASSLIHDCAAAYLSERG